MTAYQDRVLFDFFRANAHSLRILSVSVPQQGGQALHLSLWPMDFHRVSLCAYSIGHHPIALCVHHYRPMVGLRLTGNRTSPYRPDYLLYVVHRLFELSSLSSVSFALYSACCGQGFAPCMAILQSNTFVGIALTY
jgi:hypothetical protein